MFNACRSTRHRAIFLKRAADSRKTKVPSKKKCLRERERERKIKEKQLNSMHSFYIL